MDLNDIVVAIRMIASATIVVVTLSSWSSSIIIIKLNSTIFLARPHYLT